MLGTGSLGQGDWSRADVGCSVWAPVILCAVRLDAPTCCGQWGTRDAHRCLPPRVMISWTTKVEDSASCGAHCLGKGLEALALREPSSG